MCQRALIYKGELIMKGVEIKYADVCIGALFGAYRQLLQMTFGEALSETRYGKGDTKGFDASVESGIKKCLGDFNGEEIVLITEETDDVTSRVWPIDPNPKQQPKMFFSDPVDRSKYLEQIINLMAKKLFPDDDSGENAKKRSNIKVAELLMHEDIVKLWDKEVDAPASITGATAAITYVNRGRVIFSVILNFITRDIYVACDIGIKSVRIDKDFKNIPTKDPLEYIMREGREIVFPSAMERSLVDDDLNNFVTFLGKDMYKEIFVESGIVPGDYKKFIHHDRPGGPSRVLYLSDLQPKEAPVGFILANGEKIGEWMHWLPFVKFARNFSGNPALRLYEVSLKKALFKNDILVSTPPAYSIFNCRDEKKYIDVSIMKNHAQPSRFRSMLVIASSDNERIGPLMDRFEYRDVGMCL
ncbi:hypothetical protein HN784_05120 [bacterium]|jgi:hypothetical protein|nr:hypothetical protein [bacterium]MBT6753792.1 hypothetical protein [bacterium]MBT7432196.1 hypothetical protein [bacterium]MBT7992269.1 hypothetical protein [bacterium]